MKNRIKLVLMFAGGLVSGIFIRLGVEVINLRPKSPGGEALFPLLIVLLMVAGYFIGRETKVHGDLREAQRKGHLAGYEKGFKDAKNSIFATCDKDANVTFMKFKKTPGR